MPESAAPWGAPGASGEEFRVLVPCRTVLPLGLRDMVSPGHPELLADDDDEAAPNVRFREDRHNVRAAAEPPDADCVLRIPREAGRAAAVAEHDRDRPSGVK